MQLRSDILGEEIHRFEWRLLTARGDALNEQSGGLLVAKADKGYARSPDVRSQFRTSAKLADHYPLSDRGSHLVVTKKLPRIKKDELYANPPFLLQKIVNNLLEIELLFILKVGH